MKTLIEYINEMRKAPDNSKLREHVNKIFTKLINYINNLKKENFTKVEWDVLNIFKYSLQDTVSNIEDRIDDVYKLQYKDVIDAIIGNLAVDAKEMKLKMYPELDEFLNHDESLNSWDCKADEFIAKIYKDAIHRDMPNPYK